MNLHKVLIYVLFYMQKKKKKKYNLSRFQPDFWFLVKSKMAAKMGTIVGDLHLMRRSKAFQWRQNRFETLQHIEKLWGGVHQPPPPPLYHYGVSICVSVRGLNADWGTET